MFFSSRQWSSLIDDHGAKSSSSKVPSVSTLPSQRSVKRTDGAKTQATVKWQTTTSHSDDIENEPPKQTVRTQYVRGLSPDDQDFLTGTKRAVALSAEVDKYTPLGIAIERRKNIVLVETFDSSE